MTIGKRIALLAVVLLALAGVLGTVSLVSNSRVADTVHSLSEQSLPAVRLIGNINSTILDLRGATLHHVATPDPKVKAAKDVQSADLEKRALGFIADYQKLIVTDQDRQLFAPIPVAAERYFRACEQVRTLSRRHLSRNAMTVYDTEGDAARSILKKAIADELEYNRVSAAENSAAADATASRAKAMLGILLAGALLAGIVLAAISIRAIGRVLRESIVQLDEGATQGEEQSSFQICLVRNFNCCGFLCTV